MKATMKKLNKDLLFIHYVKQNLSMDRTAVLMETSRKTVRKNLVYYGIPIKKKFMRVSVPPKQELEQLYLKNEYTWEMMKAHYKISNDTLNRWLNGYEIRKRKKYEKGWAV